MSDDFDKAHSKLMFLLRPGELKYVSGEKYAELLDAAADLWQLHCNALAAQKTAIQERTCRCGKPHWVGDKYHACLTAYQLGIKTDNDPLSSPAHYNVGGTKHDSDKPRMDLLDAEALEELTKVLTFGAKKYAVENWRKGISFRRLLAAALRHVFAFMRGEDKDPETGLSHMAHAMCCAMFVIWMQRHRPDMDDRYKHDIQTPAES